MRTQYNRMQAAVGAISLLLVASSAFAQADADPSLAAMRKAGEAKIAIAAAPPWAFLAPNGEAQGYLVEVSGQALKALGVPKLAPTVTTWDAMIPGLQAKRFDLVPAGLLITAARCQVVAFSSPITAQQDALYVVPGNPKRLNGYADVASASDVKLAVLTGSSQEAYALSKGVKADQLVRVPDIQAGVATVVGGRANAFAVGQFSVPKPSERGVEVMVDRQAPVSSIAIAFRKEDAKLRDAFNKQLDAMRASGAMKDLYAGKYAMPNWDTLAKVTKVNDVVPGCE
jgi:polar amino acid transport system substrate-binding protein